MKIIFYSHANKTHFHKEGFALSLVLKVRVLEPGNGLVICQQVLLKSYHKPMFNV